MLYIVRHCDKDTANGCSAEGYDSAVRWKDFFNNMNLKNPIVYAFGFSLKKCDDTSTVRANPCPVDVRNVIDNTAANCSAMNYKNGSASQRAFLTACPIATSYNSSVITRFVVGKEDNLVEDIYQQDIGSDIIVVWEHNAIIDIFNSIAKHFGKKTKFPPWSASDESYNLMFSMPRNTTKMPPITIQCYSKLLPGADCSTIPKFVQKMDSTITPTSWQLPKVTNFLTKKEQYSGSKNSNESKKSNMVIILVVFLILLLILSIVAYMFYKNKI
jgi:hypothetical protein